MQNPPSCVLFYQRLADLFQPGTRVAQNKSARPGLRVGRGTTHTLQCAGSEQSAAAHRRANPGVGLGEVGRVPQLFPSSPTHSWRDPWCPKMLSGSSVSQIQQVVTPQVRARHLATLPERRGSSGEAMKTGRRQMSVRAGMGSLWDPREQQDRRDPTSCRGNARLSLRSALLLLLLTFLLLLISATSSSCSLPAISKAPSRRERLSRTLERIPWVAIGHQRTPRGPRSTCPAGT